MILKTTNPITSSQRHLIKLCRKNLKNQPLLKSSLKGMRTNSGRNNSGKITIRHKGGGHKRKYRTLNFVRVNNSQGIICSIEYDPNRNASIASVFEFKSAQFFYIIAPKRLKVGDIISSGALALPLLGNTLPLERIPIGSYIHNICPTPTKPAQISRSAGTFSILVEKIKNQAQIKLSSGKQVVISVKSCATVGTVSNELARFTRLGKAGQSRWLNKRPRVRGVAMNPVDHPHGGGEGKKSGRGKTPWGKPKKKIKFRKQKITQLLKY